jgi:hypothetical protein
MLPSGILGVLTPGLKRAAGSSRAQACRAGAGGTTQTVHAKEVAGESPTAGEVVHG